MKKKSTSDHLLNDPDRGKGSQEPDERGQSGNNSMQGQLGHRNPDPLQDGADSDFPEPGHSPEHSFEGEFKKKEKENCLVESRAPSPGKTLHCSLSLSHLRPHLSLCICKSPASPTLDFMRKEICPYPR